MIVFGDAKENLYAGLMRLSHLNALRALEATLRHGSFTAAAGELGITPAAVGQRVRALEDYIGRELFQRTSNGVVPRKAALEVGALLTDGFGSIASALEHLRPMPVSRRLTVTMPESFAENWLGPYLAEFMDRFPATDLQLDASNRDVDLEHEGFDFAIRYGPDRATDMEEHHLFGDIVLPVCTAEFARHHKITPGLRSLAGIPLVHVLNRTQDPGWVGFEEWGRIHGFDPVHLDHGVRFSKASTGLQSAIAGQGLVLCGVVEAFHALKSGALVLPFGPAVGSATAYQYRLVRVGRRSATRMQKDFSDWVTSLSRRYLQELDRLLKNPT